MDMLVSSRIQTNRENLGATIRVGGEKMAAVLVLEGPQIPLLCGPLHAF